MGMSRVRVFAPASLSNLGPGFDVLGLALDEPGDIVEAELSERPGVELAGVAGDGRGLPREPERNVAVVAAAEALRRVEGRGPAAGSARGVRLRLEKGIPLASGLGGSAASSVGAAVAVNALFGSPLDERELIESALAGERLASGSTHADNVAPCLLGGIVLVAGYDPLDVVPLPVPPGLAVAVVRPHCTVTTAEARALVRERTFPIDRIVTNLAGVGAFVSALYRGDLKLLGRAVRDALVEPVRAGLVPALADVEAAARDAGALGSALSGSGPSVFAFCEGTDRAARVAAAMQAAFARAGVASETVVSLVSPAGARPV